MGILRDSIRRQGRSPVSAGTQAAGGGDPLLGFPPAAGESPSGTSAQALTPGGPLPAPAPGAPSAPEGQSGPGAHARLTRSETRRRRDALAEEVTELHWDLGGLAYEMAIRDHFRLDVLVRRAAILQERDAELAEVERLLRMEEDGIAGPCPACGAPHSRGATFCWQCGATLMEQMRVGAVAAAEEQQATEQFLAPGAAGADGAPGSASGDGLAGGAGAEG